MLFSHKRTILYITKENIQWVCSRVPDGKFLSEAKSLPWSAGNLDVALDDIISRFPRKIRIVVGEEFSYVTHFQKNDKTGSIMAEAQNFIPEKLQDGWDSREEKSGDVQIMAIQQELFAILKKSVTNRDIHVEAIEAESVSIARIIQAKESGVFIFAKNKGKIIFGIAQGSEVLATKIFSELPDKEQIKKFIDYATVSKGSAPIYVYIQDKSGDLVKNMKELGYEVREAEMSPMLGISHKNDLNGRDRDVLNIFLGQLSKGENRHEIKKGHLNLREKILLGIFVAVILGGVAVIYYVQKNRQKSVQMAPTTQPGANMDQSGLKWAK